MVSNGLGLVESVFGMVPGGVGEMVAAVASIDGDSALVAGMHLVRLVVVVSVMGSLVRWFRRRGARGAGGQLGMRRASAETSAIYPRTYGRRRQSRCNVRTPTSKGRSSASAYANCRNGPPLNRLVDKRSPPA